MKVNFKHRRADVIATVKRGKMTELNSLIVMIDKEPLEIRDLVKKSKSVMQVIEAAALVELNNRIRAQ